VITFVSVPPLVLRFRPVLLIRVGSSSFGLMLSVTVPVVDPGIPVPPPSSMTLTWKLTGGGNPLIPSLPLWL
jgi:hypothetical protein